MARPSEGGTLARRDVRGMKILVKNHNQKRFDKAEKDFWRARKKRFDELSEREFTCERCQSVFLTKHSDWKASSCEPYTYHFRCPVCRVYHAINLSSEEADGIFERIRGEGL